MSVTIRRTMLAVALLAIISAPVFAQRTGTTGTSTPSRNYVLTVNYTPSDAQLSIDGRNRRGNRFTLEQGSYTIQVAAQGYRTHTVDVNLNQNRTLNIDLSRNQHRLRVHSNVSGAEVYIDGDRVGRTSYNAELHPGSYTVEVRAAGYESAVAEINLDRDRTVNMDLERNTFELNIGSNVRNAEVFVDGNRVGTTNYSGSFAQGSYSIRVTADGYRDFISRVNLTSDQSLTANLQPQNGSVILDFPARTANVFFYIDGDRMPVNVRQSREELSLSPGVYSFKFSAGGIESEEIDLTIEAGRTLRLRPSLSFEITD